jgi:hypothetical protein
VVGRRCDEADGDNPPLRPVSGACSLICASCVIGKDINARVHALLAELAL